MSDSTHTLVMPASSTLTIVTVTLVAQAIVSMATLTLPVIAPRFALVIGMDPSAIGFQVSILYAGAMLSSAFGGRVVCALGACRSTQASLSAVAVGMLIALVPNLAALFLASVLIGLGYGLSNPAAAHLLVRYTPIRGRNLIFSLKQTGVPLGGMMAALLAPSIADIFGWRWALSLVAALGFAMAAMLQWRRNVWDDDRLAKLDLRGNLLGGVPLIWRKPPLRYLALTALCFAGVQLCVMTFTVTLLVTDARYSLVEAGFLLSMVQLAGATGRIFWGWAADRFKTSNGVLLTLGGIMVLASLVIMGIDREWAPGWTSVAFLVIGATAIGWNGVFLAEVARLAPRGQAGVATGGALFFTFGGVLIAPSVFATGYRVLGSYTLTFGIAALFAAVGFALLVWARVRGRQC